MEKEIVEKGLTYPRITNDEIEEKMKSVGYHCHVVPGTTTTVITATLPMTHLNFTLGTDIMACVDPRNFNAELGVKYGTEKVAKIAKDTLWMLEGYRLAHDIANGTNAAVPTTAKERLVAERDGLRTKLDKLVNYFDTDHYESLELIARELLTSQSDHMLKYLAVVEHRLQIWED